MEAGAEIPKFARQISIEDGLSQTTVSSIFQAPDGRMWFATGEGVNIYDGDRFEYIYRGDSFKTGLQSNYIYKIAADPSGRIWVGTFGGGISVFSASGEFLKGFKASPELADQDDIYDFVWSDHNTVWVATGGGMTLLKLDENSFKTKDILLLPPPFYSEFARAVLQLSENRLLIGTRSNGLILFNISGDKIASFSKNNSGLVGDSVTKLFRDSRGNIWIAMEDGGVNLLESDHKTITQPLVLPDNDIESIAEGNDGRLWFGAWSKGIFVYDPKSALVENYRAQVGQSQRLSSDTVISLTPDKSGRMWAGTYDRGISNFSQFPDPFQTYFADPNGKSGPISPVVWSFEEDRKKVLWVGTKKGLSRFDPADDSFEYIDLGIGEADIRAILRHQDGLLLAIKGRGIVELNTVTNTFSDVLGAEKKNVFHDYFVRLLMEDRNGKIWVGTHSGVFRLNRDLDIELQISDDGTPQGLPHNRVRSLFEAPDGTVWIGTSGGLTRYDDKTGEVQSFSGPQYFLDNDIRAVWQHSNGNLYIASQAGFSILDSELKLIRHVGRKDGLPNETLYSLLPDGIGNLWIATNNGLANFNIENQLITAYRSRDGLQGAEFNFNAYKMLSDGGIVVGGVNGFSIFDPAKLKTNRFPPLVNVAGSLPPVDATAPFSTSFDITVSHYEEPENNQLKWKLEPVNKNWNFDKGSFHHIVRENLPAGQYNLFYKGISAGGVESDQQVLKFAVSAPWYQQWYSIFFFILTLLGSGYFLAKLRSRALEKQASQLKLLVMEKTDELSKANEMLASAYNEKARFYARAAHEIRTPISLIKAPVQNLEKSSSLTEENRSFVRLIKQSLDRLASLTNEMALATSDVKNVNDKTSCIDLRSFVEPIISLYQENAQLRGLTLEREISHLGAVTLETEALETILHNLLSNALNHTKPQGHIDCCVGVANNHVVVRVQNDGVLTDKAIANFENFPVKPGEFAQKGSEIVGAIVRRVKGKIICKKSPAEISVYLPAHYKQVSARGKNSGTQYGPYNILVVEDDRQMREYLMMVLKEHGCIHGAASATSAKRAISKNIPNLIICDVMLPDGNGFELVRKIKESPETSHIPAIFLTALSDKDSYNESLAAWGDDYLTKPFDVDELTAKVSIRLRSIELIRKHILSQNIDTISSNQLNGRALLYPASEEFLVKLEQYITENIGNPDFSIEALASSCAVSRRSLQRKLVSLCGLNFSQLLTRRRMELALHLLENQKSIKEVYQRCGYRHPSSFSRAFKQEYGILPSHHRKAMHNTKREL